MVTPVNGTTPGSVNGPHLFNIFINDLDINNSNSSIITHADDIILLCPVNMSGLDCLFDLFISPEYLNWSQDNSMLCNVNRCKQCKDVFEAVINIVQVDSLKILDVTLQNNLVEAYRGLHIFRGLRKEDISNKCLSFVWPWFCACGNPLLSLFLAPMIDHIQNGVLPRSVFATIPVIFVNVKYTRIHTDRLDS